ncbi:MAG: SUMF1/EgtB/PvdO family nonheme iron enzyme [Deltaproteobacteria bacterium]|nr:SUMF1/EgtB/PvdO family nonheme iron enzyme [Deltaproteobacteria bacterium]
MGESSVGDEIRLPRRPGFDPEFSTGLFVGVSEFEDVRFQAVPFAVDDAVDLAHLFAFELKLLRPQRAVLALSGEPRKEESQERLAQLLEAGARRETARHPDIYRLLGEQSRGAGKKGIFLLSLATHGLSEQGRDFLIASDSLREEPIHTSVAVSRLFDKVSDAPAPRRMVLLDACRERLSQGMRGEAGEGMARTFAEAIAQASGQVVLSGATHGGFAYDDLERGNGVFTAAVLDGLRGAAPADEQGHITVGDLARYLQQRVVEWVKRHRPEHAARSFGIAQQIEGPAESLPLAVDPHRARQLEAYRQRRTAALEKLGASLGGRLDGSVYDQVSSLLPVDGPLPAKLEPLLEEVEALDKTPRAQQSLLFLLGELKGGDSAALGSGKSGESAAPWPSPLAAPEPPRPVLRGVEPREKTKGQPNREGLVVGPDTDGSARKVALALAVFLALCLAAVASWRYFSKAQQMEQPSMDISSIEPKKASPEDPLPGIEEGPKAPEEEPNSTPPASNPTAAEPEPREREVVQNTSPTKLPAKKVPLPTPVAKPLPDPKAGTLRTSPTGLRLRFIPAGTYTLGSPADEPGRFGDEPLRTVTLTQGFWLGETEVTQALWTKLVGANPSHFEECGDGCPVERVSWFEAIAFANLLSQKEGLAPCYRFDQPQGKLGSQGATLSEVPSLVPRCTGYRLPTEAEWEVAARAGTKTALYTGRLTLLGSRHGPELDDIAWYGGNSGVDYPGAVDCSSWSERQYPKPKECGPHPVGLKKANAWGLEDMLGNVWEWTWDIFDKSPSPTATDPLGPSEGTRRVIRGGSWYYFARSVRAAYRNRRGPSNRDYSLGFRLAQGQGLLSGEAEP